jgi:sec-independent protein translocase protein TatC
MAINRNHLDGILNYLEALRRPLLVLGVATIVLTAAGFRFAPAILIQLQQQTGVPLAAFGIPDIFLAYVYVAAGIALLVLAPAVAYYLLSRLDRIGKGLSASALWTFGAAAVLLFFAGAGFCFHLTLPYGAQFLLSYAGSGLRPVISVTSFVGFCIVLIFGFGLTFNLPLVMILFGRMGLIRRETLGRHRSHAVMVITVLAAVLTPTPDVLNLLLLALPLYLLFELGLVGMRLSKGTRG